MSSDPARLRLNRALRGVRGGSAARARSEGASAQQIERIARQRRELDEREEALARREADLARKERQIERRLDELASLIGSVKQEREELLEASEEQIVSFSLSITEKVLQCEIENGRYRIGEVVRSTLQAVRSKGALVLRVNPRDHELAQAAVQRLGKTFGTTRITTVPDESIPLASCCIETDSGKVFSEIPGRLERIRNSLMKRSGEGDGV